MSLLTYISLSHYLHCEGRCSLMLVLNLGSKLLILFFTFCFEFKVLLWDYRRSFALLPVTPPWKPIYTERTCTNSFWQINSLSTLWPGNQVYLIIWYKYYKVLTASIIDAVFLFHVKATVLVHRLLFLKNLTTYFYLQVFSMLAVVRPRHCEEHHYF